MRITVWINARLATQLQGYDMTPGRRTRLRAVVTQIEDGFIVSLTLVSAADDPVIIGEQLLATLDAAHEAIEQMGSEMNCPSETIERIYNLDDVPPDQSQAH